ncbi:MAG: 30S ribosome-binding factor RbfA [Patescibacteria group bacterium]
MKHRVERVNNLIQEELSKIIVKELEFPALVTITEVETSKDLSQALVKFSVLPSEKSEEVLKILNKNLRHLQYLLMKKINIKPMPRISFEIDWGLEKAAEIEKILLNDKINE